MRRKDRELSNEDTLAILTNAEYGVLSTVSSNGLPYGVPINFCIIDEVLYFHCALEGSKLDNLSQNTAIPGQELTCWFNYRRENALS